MFLLLSFFVSPFVLLCFHFVRKISRIITRKLFQLSEQKLLNLIIIKHGKKNLRKRKLIEVELSLPDQILFYQVQNISVELLFYYFLKFWFQKLVRFYDLNHNYNIVCVLNANSNLKFSTVVLSIVFWSAHKFM